MPFFAAKSPGIAIQAYLRPCKRQQKAVGVEIGQIGCAAELESKGTPQLSRDFVGGTDPRITCQTGLGWLRVAQARQKGGFGEACRPWQWTLPGEQNPKQEGDEEGLGHLVHAASGVGECGKCLMTRLDKQGVVVLKSALAGRKLTSEPSLLPSLVSGSGVAVVGIQFKQAYRFTAKHHKRRCFGTGRREHKLAIAGETA